MQSVDKRSDQWIMMKDAPSELGRARSTIYKWVKARKIRTLRPGKELWLYLPDLKKAEAESLRRVGA